MILLRKSSIVKIVSNWQKDKINKRWQWVLLDCKKKWNFIFYSIFINSHCTIVNFAVVTSWGYCVTCILLSIKIRHERDLSKKGEQWMSVSDKYVYIDGKRKSPVIRIENTSCDYRTGYRNFQKISRIWH